MANYFWRKAVVGADNNAWAAFNDSWIRAAIGELSAELYNDAGTLKVTKGRAGINDGVTEGIAILDTIETPSLAAVSNGIWAKVEMTVAGTAVTIAAADIAGATDESTIPASVKAAYDYDKRGYYLTASKRLLGIVYKRTGGTVGRIVNCENGQFGFRGIEYIDYAISKTGIWTKKYIATLIFEIGDWNMDSTTNLEIALNEYIVGLTKQQIRDVKIEIRDDSGTYFDWSQKGDASTNSLFHQILTVLLTDLRLTRTIGGYFDNANYNETSYNRGYITIKWET